MGQCRSYPRNPHRRVIGVVESREYKSMKLVWPLVAQCAYQVSCKLLFGSKVVMRGHTGTW